MAEKRGGGAWFWLLLGVVAGVALTLATLLFLNAGGGDAEEGRSLADEAAAAARAPELPAPPPPAEPEKKAGIPRLPDAGLDPATDDQIAEDAAAAGATSRTPPPSPDGE